MRGTESRYKMNWQSPSGSCMKLISRTLKPKAASLNPKGKEKESLWMDYPPHSCNTHVRSKKFCKIIFGLVFSGWEFLFFLRIYETEFSHVN